MNPEQEDRLEHIPLKYQSVTKRAYSGRSKAAGIKAKCLDCVGWEDAVDRIRHCTIEACPLWPYRPYQVED